MRLLEKLVGIGVDRIGEVGNRASERRVSGKSWSEG